MFLKFLEFLGRKKVVLDRGPSHPNLMKQNHGWTDIMFFLDIDLNGFHLIYWYMKC